VVNLAYVSRITRKDVLMDSGETLPVSRNRWEALNRAYLNYYKK
jgi:DNA-binding LytR/AlgR family response regulator